MLEIIIHRTPLSHFQIADIFIKKFPGIRYIPLIPAFLFQLTPNSDGSDCEYIIRRHMIA
jgi:hypothetical protein